LTVKEKKEASHPVKGKKETKKAMAGEKNISI